MRKRISSLETLLLTFAVPGVLGLALAAAAQLFK